MSVNSACLPTHTTEGDCKAFKKFINLSLTSLSRCDIVITPYQIVYKAFSEPSRTIKSIASSSINSSQEMIGLGGELSNWRLNIHPLQMNLMRGK
ncbi:hypothetical protein NPIL_599181 [Nephila pilipes]|uniref:Uncharacterized protein n=1 Tax=Nephila pilipes TaxID=299642 RepID=A0A8X6NE47_NEPPI|nr:hypothetical protein NPIL_599181 [Nephila pilipes]